MDKYDRELIATMEREAYERGLADGEKRGKRTVRLEYESKDPKHHAAARLRAWAENGFVPTWDQTSPPEGWPREVAQPDTYVQNYIKSAVLGEHNSEEPTAPKGAFTKMFEEISNGK